MVNIRHHATWHGWITMALQWKLMYSIVNCKLQPGSLQVCPYRAHTCGICGPAFWHIRRLWASTSRFHDRAFAEWKTDSLKTGWNELSYVEFNSFFVFAVSLEESPDAPLGPTARLNDLLVLGDLSPWTWDSKPQHSWAAAQTWKRQEQTWSVAQKG